MALSCAAKLRRCPLPKDQLAGTSTSQSSRAMAVAMRAQQRVNKFVFVMSESRFRFDLTSYQREEVLYELSITIVPITKTVMIRAAVHNRLNAEPED